MCMKSRVPAPVWGPAFLKLPLCIEAEWLQQRFAMRTPIVPHGLVLLSLPPPPAGTCHWLCPMAEVSPLDLAWLVMWIRNFHQSLIPS